MTPVLFLWHKIDTLHETSHTIVDWEALIMATKNLPQYNSDGKLDYQPKKSQLEK